MQSITKQGDLRLKAATVALECCNICAWKLQYLCLTMISYNYCCHCLQYIAISLVLEGSSLSLFCTFSYETTKHFWLSCRIGSLLRFYSVFENGQWKVKVFQMQYSILINSIWNIENEKDSNNDARTPYVATTSPPPPSQYFRKVTDFLTKMKFRRAVAKFQLHIF